mgnify:FL=1
MQGEAILEINKNMSKIYELANEYPELTINVKLSDLLECNRQLIQETKDKLTQQIAEANEESYPTVDEVVSMLNVSKTTLWRWAKQRYLNPVEIGGKRRYKMSEVKSLLEGQR